MKKKRKGSEKQQTLTDKTTMFSVATGMKEWKATTERRKPRKRKCPKPARVQKEKRTHPLETCNVENNKRVGD